MKVGNRFKKNRKKRLLYLSIAFLGIVILALPYSSNALIISRLLQLNFWDNPIQNGFHGSLPLVSFIFYLSGNCRNKY